MLLEFIQPFFPISNAATLGSYKNSERKKRKVGVSGTPREDECVLL